MDWSNVDGSPDPGWFVRFIESSRARSSAGPKADPKAALSFLELGEGMSVIDVGCGIGFFDDPIATIVGPRGRVVGVDASATMIAEAKKRKAPRDLPLEFQVGSAYALEFGENTFDRALALALFQHLHKPDLALAEMIRVTKPGGKVVVGDHDWGTLSVDAADGATTRAVVEAMSDSLVDGWAGRKTPSRFKDAGLEGVKVEGTTLVMDDLELLEEFLVKPAAASLPASGLLPAAKFEAWRADLHGRAKRGRLFWAVTMYRTSGFKPTP